MELTIDQAIALEEGGKKIRAITMEQLAESETDVGTIRPLDAVQHFMGSVTDKLGHLHIGDLELWGSHIEITSVNGQVVYINPGGADPKKELFRGVSHDEKMNLGVKYNRIFGRLKVGLEKELTDTLYVMYALDRKRYVIAHGKTVTVADSMAVPAEEALFKGTPKEIGGALEKFEDYLDNFYHHDVDMEDWVLSLKKVWLEPREVDAVFAEHLYRSALLAQKMRRGVAQIFDDNTLKTAIFLLYNTIHPYRARGLTPESEEFNDYGYRDFGTGAGMSAFDLFCCFSEALGLNNNDLVATIDKQVNCFKYFNALVQRKSVEP